MQGKRVGKINAKTMRFQILQSKQYPRKTNASQRQRCLVELRWFTRHAPGHSANKTYFQQLKETCSENPGKLLRVLVVLHNVPP